MAAPIWPPRRRITPILEAVAPRPIALPTRRSGRIERKVTSRFQAECHGSRKFTNHHGSDGDGPTRHASPSPRTRTTEVLQTLASAQRLDILQPPLAVALQRPGGAPRLSPKRAAPALRQQLTETPGTRRIAHSFRCNSLRGDRRPLPVRKELVHLLHSRSSYASRCSLLVFLVTPATTRK
jgi:hypothetical protein